MATIEQQPTKPITLSTPLKVGDVELSNRNVMSAMTRNRALPDTVPTDIMAEHYTQRAEGGAGLIVTEGVLICPQGTAWPWAPGLWTKEQTEGWKKVTADVHTAGGKIFAQLWHVGRIANNDMPEQKKAGKPVPGPSANFARGGEGQFKRSGLPAEAAYSVATPMADPRSVVEDYKVAARNAKEAGFDGVELHSANGYLLTQFLDNTVNKRTDEWGGSAENRARLGLEVVEALIEIWGPGRVGVKLSPAGGYNDVGMSLEDTLETFTYYMKKLIALKVAYITIGRFRENQDVEFDGKKRGTPIDVLQSFGHLFKHPEVSGSTKLFINGGLSPQEANELLGAGDMDGAVFGWLWIGNPDFQIRVEKGAELEYMPDPSQLYHSKTADARGGYNTYPKGKY